MTRTPSAPSLLLWSLLSMLSTATALLWPAPAAAQIGFRAVGQVGLGDELSCIGISHRDPNFVMVGTASGRIQRTTDGGATWQESIVTPARSLFYGRERSPDPRLEYALGLPGKSPHLQSWLRQKGLNTSGVNMQQLLVQKGDKSVAVNWIEVDWHDENRIFVGTVDGIYRSLDKGRSFLRIWQGQNSMQERVINTIVTDPATPNRLLVGTASGLFVSTDGGATLRKEMDFYIRDSFIRGMWFDLEQQGLVHMAMGGAAMASPDSGKNWITTYWDLWGPRGDVQWISLGPQNVRVLGTRDGVFASAQGGEMGTWQRRGWRFVGQWVGKVLATTVAGAWLVTAEAGVYLTEDAGESWRKIFQTGGSEQPRWLDSFRGDPRQIWMLTNRQVYRTGEVPGLRPAARRKSQPRLLDIPSLQRLVVAVLRHKRLHFPELFAYKQRAPWAALLPTFSIGAFHTKTRDLMLLRSFPFLNRPFTYHNRRFDREFYIEIYAFWELGRLIFDRREMAHFGRIERNLSYQRRELTEKVHRLYQDYVRTAKILAYHAPADLVAREFHRIRLQEIAAFFDVISGGFWTKATGGVS